MSTIKKVATGTLASWLTIIVTILSNLLLVPLFLSHWNTDTYGCWLAIQALFSTLQIVDWGHQQNLARTCNFFDLSQIRDYSRLLSSSLCVGQITALLQIVIVILMVAMGFLGLILKVPKGSESLLDDVSIVLLAQSVAYFLFGNASVILSRGIVPYGYYTINPWFGCANQTSQFVIQLICLYLGMGLLQLGLVSAVITLLFYALLTLCSLCILRRHGLVVVIPDWGMGFRNLKRSLVLTCVNIIGTLRQQGIRLLLPCIVSLAGLTQFATTRTIANVIMQAGTSILWPTSPLLMRMLREKDQKGFESCISFIWLFILLGLTPGLLILSYCAGPIFYFWTHGTIPYDPLLIALFSAGALAFCASETCMIVITGYNPLRTQLSLSIINSAVLLGFFFMLTRLFSLRGAAFSLMLTEISNMFISVFIARSLIKVGGLLFPAKIYSLGYMCVFVNIISILIIAIYPAFYLAALILYFSSLGIVCWIIIKNYGKVILQMNLNRKI